MDESQRAALCRDSALYLRSVYSIKTAFHGLSTYVTGFFTLLARYFSGCASRSISMRLWTEFAKGSNFRKFGPVWFQLRRVRSTEIDIGEVCKAGHSFAEVRPVEVCVVEVRPRKVCPT